MMMSDNECEGGKAIGTAPVVDDSLICLDIVDVALSADEDKTCIGDNHVDNVLEGAAAVAENHESDCASGTASGVTNDCRETVELSSDEDVESDNDNLNSSSSDDVKTMTSDCFVVGNRFEQSLDDVVKDLDAHAREAGFVISRQKLHGEVEVGKERVKTKVNTKFHASKKYLGELGQKNSPHIFCVLPEASPTGVSAIVLSCRETSESRKYESKKKKSPFR